MSTSPAPSHPPTPSHQQQQQQPPPPGVSDQDWALRLEQEKRMTQQLAAKNEALNSQQQFVVERAADMALQQQQRIAQLEAQLGAAAPAVPGDSYSSGNGNNNNSRTPSAQQQQNSSNNNTTNNSNIINVRHGCPRCSTCNTLLQTVGQLETMLQNRDSDCDVLRKALDDAQRVNALLLEQIDLLQRGLEKALLNRHIPQDFQGPAKQLPLHHSVSPPSIHHNHNHQQQEAASASSESNTNNNTSGSEQQKEPIASFNSSNLPANMRMLQPSSEPTLRAMADAVASLQNLWLDMSSSPASSRYKPAPAVPPSKLDV